jgi:hypothetical protein
MGYCSRLPHRVPLLSAKNNKKWFQCARDHQHRTFEEWKIIAWSDESQFLLRLMPETRLGESRMRPILPDVNSTGWEMFSWHTLGLWILNEQRLNATAYLNIVADQT